MDDALGDRMKTLEQAEAGRRFIPLLPVVARLDGKGFHNFTKGMERPYDKRLTDIMVKTMLHLVEAADAKIGYTQSDEISLIIYSGSYESQTYFDGKIQKLTSVLASMATMHFNSLIGSQFESRLWVRPNAIFDCRVWTVPNKEEAVNAILWREFDASKNSISMAARSHFSHKELQNKTGSEMQEMLFSQKGVNWNDYPVFFKRGTYGQRKSFMEEMTEEQRMAIPEKNRPVKGTLFERSRIVPLEMPQLSKIINRVSVIFDGEAPKILE